MDALPPNLIRAAIAENWTMRVGRKLRRTLYLCDPHSGDPLLDVCVGMVDSEDLAVEIMLRWNGVSHE